MATSDLFILAGRQVDNAREEVVDALAWRLVVVITLIAYSIAEVVRFQAKTSIVLTEETGAFPVDKCDVCECASPRCASGDVELSTEGTTGWEREDGGVRPRRGERCCETSPGHQRHPHTSVRVLVGRP